MFAAIAGLVASSLFSYVASKAVTKWTGNETLGMIAGAAVGFGMGSYMSGAGKAVTATSSTGTGSTTTAGTNLMAGGEAAQFDIMSGGMAPSGSAAAEVNLFGDALTGGTGVAADATGGIMTSGISPAAQGVGEGVSAATESVQGGGLFDKLMGGGKKLTEYLGSAEGKSMIGKGIKGYQEQKNIEEAMELQERDRELAERKQEFAEEEAGRKSAFGVSRAGDRSYSSDEYKRMLRDAMRGQ